MSQPPLMKAESPGVYTSLEQMHIGGHIVNRPVICMAYGEQFFRSIFFGHNPLNYMLPVFIMQIVAAFFVSRLVNFILRPLKQPKVVSYLLAGVILGPTVLGRSKAYMDRMFPDKEIILFNTAASIGKTYYIFITAVKMDTGMLFRSVKNDWIVGMSSFILPFIVHLTYKISTAGHLPLQDVVLQILLSGGMTVTYFPTVARAMEEHKLLTSELGLVAMSSAMISEFFGWFIMFLVTAYMQRTFYFGIQALIGLALVMAFAIYVVRPYLKKIIKRTPPGKPVHEGYVIGSLVGALLMGLLTELMGGSSMPGALLMGLIIPDGPPLGSTIVEKSEFMIMEFFLPLIYVQIGSVIDLYDIAGIKRIFVALLPVILVYFSKTITTFLVSNFYCKFRPRSAVLLSLILNLKGVLDITNYQLWQLNFLVDRREYSGLVVLSILYSAVICPMIELFHEPQVRLSANNFAAKLTIRSLQSTPLSAELRVLTCIHNEDNVPSIVTLLEASNPSEISPICAYVVHIIELIGRATPFLVPYRSTRKSLLPSNTDQIVRAFENYVENSRGPVTLQPFAMIAPYDSMENLVSNFAEDKNVPFILVVSCGNQPAGRVDDKLLRNFHSRLQAYARCTVGVLVDRGLNQRIDLAHFFYNVAVVFVGGPDDREALALAIRMSGNPNVSITLMRIDIKTEVDDEIQRRLDDLLFKEFKDKNQSNACVVCNEVVAEDSVQMMDLVRSFRNNYDLAIVGKRSSKVWIDNGTCPWLEYPELGIIGDLLASTDVYGASLMSVLVVQQFKEAADATNVLPKPQESGPGQVYCSVYCSHLQEN